MSLFSPEAEASVRTNRSWGVAGALALAVVFGGFVAVALAASAKPSATLALAAGIALLAALSLALARYETAAGLSMLILGVVFVEPAPPDALLMVVIAVALVTGSLSLSRVPLPILGLLACFVFLNLVSGIFVNNTTRAAFFLMITVYLIGFGVWIPSFVDSARRARILLTPLLVGASVSSVIGVAVLYLNFPGRSLLDFSDHARARGFFKDPNVFGPFCVLCALFLVAELLEPRVLRARRATKLLMLAALALGVIFAASRAAWLNAAVALVVMIVSYALRRGGSRKVAILLVTLAAIGATTTIALAASGSASFLGSRSHEQNYDLQRFAAQRAGLRIVQDYPLGIGPGQFEHDIGYASHSTYVRVLAEQGFMGLFVFLALVLATLGLATRNVFLGRDTFGISSVPLLAGLCGLLANSTFVDTLHWRHTWLVLGLIWAGAMRPAAAASPG